LSSSQQTLDYIQFVITVGFAILLVFVATIVWWVTRSVIRPISQTAAAAERLADGDLDDRVVIRGENEAAVLGASFNEMADSIQHQIEQLETLSKMQQRFVSDVSHELRTPLAAIRGYSDLLKWTEDLTGDGQRSLGRIDSQSQRMAALVEDLLLLARLDQGHQPVSEDVDLTELVVESVSDLQVA
ncbi:HAMP domain-containing histidine kinase, partial [Staphylococcus sp. EG-SA-29]|nr:HAMP domain-containing histidine kinase [Staphylococcus sp. EG-SA-29]